ncbi:MAG: NAD(P)H-dependent oxidoreductase [Erythrobacter sp.]|jgi:multimeric flavodoxin WrbA|nr:NAD(P)H-dependent oxidoreductase [Erythrobacter sp.]
METTGPTPKLAIVWHSRTGASQQLAAAAAEGAREEGGETVLLSAPDATPELLLACGGYLFVCPENLGGLSGAMKEMFDRCYYPLMERIEGRPYATIIAAGSGGEGAQRQLDTIVTGWRLRRVAEPIIAHMAAQTPEEILAPKSITSGQREKARTLGAGLAAGLAMGAI